MKDLDNRFHEESLARLMGTIKIPSLAERPWEQEQIERPKRDYPIHIYVF